MFNLFKKKAPVVEEKDENGTAQRFGKKWFRIGFIISALMSLLSISAFAEDSTASVDSVITAMTTVTTLVSKVFSVIVGNPVLIVYMAAGLLSTGIVVFRRLKRAAR